MDGMSNKKILDEVLELLLIQMIKDNFENKDLMEEKYIITKQELYEFAIKLIKQIKDVYNE